MAYRSKRSNNTLESRIKTLQSEFNEIQKEMRKLASEGATSVTNAASAAGEQIEEWAEEGTDTVRDAIRAQPFAAIALSMGAGAIIGSFLRR
jgi:methyl-accepting chemotaxis protein